MKKKKEKQEKPILYEAYLQKKYKNCNQEKEEEIGDLFFRSVKNILLTVWNLFIYVMAGTGIIVLYNDSTRRAFFELLSL